MAECIEMCIIIPCYNEEKRLTAMMDKFHSFIKKYDNYKLCFVDDGSKDNTLSLVKKIKNYNPSTVEIISNKVNLGKAETVRTGINHFNNIYNHEYIAFLDADLSTTLDECIRIKDYLSNKSNLVFVFASRFAKVGSVIKRKYYRFLTGRIIATFISRILALKVYDTQCGCKVFRKDISIRLFKEPFISKWLFDVELIFRMYKIKGKDNAVKMMEEVPLVSWIDYGDSKVSFSYFFKIWIDLIRINNKYKRYK